MNLIMIFAAHTAENAPNPDDLYIAVKNGKLVITDGEKDYIPLEYETLECEEQA